MKPSQIELLVYKVEIEFDKMKGLMMSTYLNQNRGLPKLCEIYMDDKRVFYLESINENPKDELLQILMKVMPAHADAQEMKAKVTEYWSTTKISPDEVALVQEVKIVDGNEIVVTNSFQFKNTFIKPKVQGFGNAR